MFEDSRFLVYAKEDCEFCTKAKALLDMIGATYQVVYERPTEWPSYPAIYRILNESEDKELIGGFNELVTFYLNYGKD